MKLLLDACVWGGAKNELETVEYDVIWAGDWPEDPGDDEVLTRAHNEDRILVTLDKDFGELAVLREIPHSGIVRLVNIAARQQAPVCMHILEQYGDELQSGAIVTAEPGWVRIRLPQVWQTRANSSHQLPSTTSNTSSARRAFGAVAHASTATGSLSLILCWSTRARRATGASSVSQKSSSYRQVRYMRRSLITMITERL